MVDLVFRLARWAVRCLVHFSVTAPPSNIHLYYCDKQGILRVRVRIAECLYYRRTHNVVRIDCSYFFLLIVLPDYTGGLKSVIRSDG